MLYAGLSQLRCPGWPSFPTSTDPWPNMAHSYMDGCGLSCPCAWFSRWRVALRERVNGGPSISVCFRPTWEATMPFDVRSSATGAGGRLALVGQYGRTRSAMPTISFSGGCLRYDFVLLHGSGLAGREKILLGTSSLKTKAGIQLQLMRLTRITCEKQVQWWCALWDPCSDQQKPSGQQGCVRAWWAEAALVA